MDGIDIVWDQLQRMGESTFRAAVLLLAVFLLRELRGMRRAMTGLHSVLTRVVNKLNGHERRIRHLEKTKK